MMIPITRKEKYINEIVGGGNTAPETPQTREELFFADILGEVVAPSPITRAEKYLAKIANKYSGELPEPVTRVERFLARAAGMDVETPTPITREEIFWSNYTAIVEFELEGVPPLTYKAIEGTLENYRIYGNTVDGESVGDRTGNLFDETNGVVTDKFIKDDGTTDIGANGDNFICNRINVLPNTTYTFSWGKKVLGTQNNTPYIRVAQYDSNGNFISRILVKANDFPNNRWVTTVENDVRLWDIRIDDVSSTRGQHLEEIMLNEGFTPLPYEPYGYKVPVTVEGKNLWDGELEQGTLASTSGAPADNNNRVRSKDFLTLSEGEYTISAKGAAAYAIVMEYDVEGTWKSDGHYRSFALLPRTINVDEIEKIKIVFMADVYDKAITVPEVTEIMLNSGTEPLPYEPYHTPVTTPIYLPEQIRKVGDEAEYIDYAQQKQYFADGTETDVTLPALPTLTGTNVLSVGTAVQPSKVYVKYKGERQ